MDRDSIADAYPPTFGSFTRAEAQGGAIGRIRDLARLLYEARWGQKLSMTSPPAGGRALDLGAGTGETLDALRRAGWDTWGVEPDERAAKVAADRSNLTEDRVIVATAEVADFSRGSFDLVVASHVVEHLHDPKEVLAKVHRWLHHEGRLILRCPNFGSLERRLFGRWWFGLDLPRHLYHFTPATLQQTLEEVGFEVVRFRPQLQGVTLSGSMQHVVDALRGRRSDFRHSRPLYYALFPLGTVLTVAGWWSCLEFEARPMRRPGS
jgi:SAM-dependent methyltransferase